MTKNSDSETAASSDNTQNQVSDFEPVAIDPEKELLQAKISFLKAAESFSPFGFVEKRPLTSVGCAFMLGAVLSGLGASKRVPPLVTTLLRAGELSSQIVPLLMKRARSSGG